MSSNTQHTLRQKRKHGEVAEKVIYSLEPYRKRPLSPLSSKLRDDLFQMAHKSLESGNAADENMLGSVFDFFEAKQEQAREAEKQRQELSNEIVSLEERLEISKQQYTEIQQSEQNMKVEKEESELLLRYGDWFQALIKHIKKPEGDIQTAEAQILKTEFETENKQNKNEAVENAKAQAAANGVQYTGNHGFQAVNPDIEAKKHSGWSALLSRMVTGTETRVEVEKGKIAEWRTGDRDEDTAPATPFLDRLQKLCDIAGVTRPILLAWIKEYAKRNNICHTKPPQIKNFQKTVNEDGMEVKVRIQHEDITGAFDWVSYKAAFTSSRNDIEARYTAGKITERRRDVFLEAINAYWALYSVSEDEGGNPILTKYAESQAKQVYDKQQSVTEPPENPRKRYKEGKWDDIEE
ncbi:hypothetical protein ACHAPU_003666 [Fusarium lateritium]